MKKIIVDTYGADLGASVVIQGTADALRCGLPFFPIMVGDKEKIDVLLAEQGISKERYEVIHTTEFVAQSDLSTVVFNGREESSMVLGYKRLKEDADCIAMISPGNTGALLVGSICRLGLLPGMKFPALASALPCAGEKLLCLVDCGANTVCTAKDLTNFAKLGDVFCRCFCEIESPRIGVMSVGKEKGKGTPVVQEAYESIEALGLNFVGNLEGGDMVSGCADVIVTDGFSGNLLLKNTEAAGKAALTAVEALDLDRDTMERIRKTLLKKFEFNARGAATFLGTAKPVVKMHGCATEETTVAAIDQALRLDAKDFSKQMADLMQPSD